MGMYGYCCSNDGCIGPSSGKSKSGWNPMSGSEPADFVSSGSSLLPYDGGVLSLPSPVR